MARPLPVISFGAAAVGRAVEQTFRSHCRLDSVEFAAAVPNGFAVLVLVLVLALALEPVLVLKLFVVGLSGLSLLDEGLIYNRQLHIILLQRRCPERAMLCRYVKCGLPCRAVANGTVIVP